jgi:hypothetical protein
MNTTPMARMAVVVTVGFFVVLGMLMFAPINLALKDPLLLMLGALIANFNSIISYYFGTTRSSQQKDGTIQALAQTAQATQVSADAAAQPTGPMQAGDVAIQAATVTVKGNP